ncbi:DUF6318 family protein [Nocardioides sp. LML1-1-1.1]|uniref:DUF6318 family protein n=1 Tax=Nocardioides sp. LML1-1-1.1 TaxID=3135248 RepID=UPI003417B464
MGWSRAVAAVVGAGALAAGVVGCTGDDPGAGPSPSPSASVSTSVSPTPEPTAAPVAPVLPAAARKATEAGARAFIAYYWALINYAQVTGDVKGLEKVSGPSCDGCKAGIDGIVKIYRGGGQVSGSLERISVDDLKSLTSKSSNAVAFHGVVTASHGSQTVTDGDGAKETRGPGSDTFDVYLLWVAKSWRLDVMAIR